MVGTGYRSCVVAGSGISAVEPSRSATRKLHDDVIKYRVTASITYRLGNEKR